MCDQRVGEVGSNGPIPRLKISMEEAPAPSVMRDLLRTAGKTVPRATKALKEACAYLVEEYAEEDAVGAAGAKSLQGSPEGREESGLGISRPERLENRGPTRFNEASLQEPLRAFDSLKGSVGALPSPARKVVVADGARDVLLRPAVRGPAAACGPMVSTLVSAAGLMNPCMPCDLGVGPPHHCAKPPLSATCVALIPRGRRLQAARHP